MATPVTMPQMGYDMTEGSVQNWIKKEGDKVNKGDTIAEIETDKATVDMEAYATGILRKIVVQPGQLVPVGAVIAVIADENEEIDWKALGVDGGGSAAVSAAPAPTPTAPAPTPAPVAQINAAPPAAVVEKKAPANGSGSTTFSRRPAAGLVNLAAPVPATSGPGGAAIPAETAAELQKTAQPIPAIVPSDPAPVQTIVAAPPPPAPSNGSVTIVESGDRLKSSPLARKVAGELGVDIAAVKGTGPGGRIIRPDVESYAKSAPAAAATAVAAVVEPQMVSATAAPMVASVSGAEYDEQPLSRMRQTIARRLTESKQQVPHIYITNEIDMTEALKLRQTINAAIIDGDKNGAKVSVNDLVLKAVAKALRKHPALNNSYVDGKLRVNHRVNVANAVAVEDGLITPVIFDADQKSIGQIALEARAQAEKARAGKLRPEEYQGGTFSVSNLGMYDVSDFVAIINPPQSAILAVGAAKPAVVVKGGSPEDGTAEFGVIQQMSVTISADHRVIDGAVAAQFLQELKRLLQNPLLLLV